jgi:malonate-semialdehyde dehydrogenase (acetylating) / methylmalonate-semialdehyde dehydrogenase
MANLNFKRGRVTARNLVGSVWQAPNAAEELELRSPWTGQVIGSVGMSGPEDVAAIVQAAREPAALWAKTPLKERVRPLARFHELVTQALDELSETVALESGKTEAEGRAGLLRGLEVVEFAQSLPNLDRGGALEVSRGVTCEYRREPLGIVAGIAPFNFPAMVPMWMFPIAITLGNAFILKPSEKVPLTACRLAELMLEAGYAPGLFSLLQGGRNAVEALIDHPEVRAVGFVGSTKAARAVHARATALGKRALCLGGAKNHLIVAPDANEALTVKSIVDSFTGCAGQRCMAGSVMVVVGEAERFVSKVVTLASRIELGRDMGALIDPAARARLTDGLAEAAREGAQILLDGRERAAPAGFEAGHWLGPSVLDQVTPTMQSAQVELFGPLLSVIRVKTLDEALALEQLSPYGNATSIFTQSGAVASYVAERATSGMVGVNIGVPVPREPFSFGGTKDSKFGQGDMTGPAGVELWSNLKKITTKWALSEDANWMS